MKPHEIMELRYKLNLTQQDFGRLLGYALGSAKIRVCELEKGRMRVSGTISQLLHYIAKFGKI